MGDGETEPMEKFGKLNQWKICVSSFPSAEKSPCKSFKCSHALMLKWNLGRVMGKTEPREKFRKLNRWKIHVSSFPSVDGISVSAIMKKLKNGCHFVNIDYTENFKLSTPPKVWVCSFLSVDGNRISVPAIMNKMKNGCHVINIDRTEKFQITEPPQSLGLWFSKC